MTIRRILMVAAMVSTVTACGAAHHNATIGGGPDPTTRPVWDPCSGIDPDTLRHAGLDPASEEADIAGVAYPGWKVCQWQPPNVDIYGSTSYYVAVFSTNSETVNHIRHDPINNHFADVTITGRAGLQYHLGGDDPSESCVIAFSTANNGVALVSLDRNIVGRYFEPVCTTTTRTAAVLLPMFPR